MAAPEPKKPMISVQVAARVWGTYEVAGHMLISIELAIFTDYYERSMANALKAGKSGCGSPNVCSICMLKEGVESAEPLQP